MRVNLQKRKVLYCATIGFTPKRRSSGLPRVNLLCYCLEVVFDLGLNGDDDYFIFPVLKPTIKFCQVSALGGVAWEGGGGGGGGG